ncbi:MAG: hypothetical protein ABI718_12250 [Acidobacteriota bacterium]
MAFYVSRKLSRGPIRFSVDHRRPWNAGDGVDDLRLSTGTDGQFLRLGDEGLYFSESVERGELQLEPIEHESTSLWSWIRPERNLAGVLSATSIAIGLVLTFLGIAVLMSKGGAAAIFEIAVGLALIIAPVTITAQKNRIRRAREEKEREERRAIEERNREIAGEFAEQLKTIPEKHDPTTLNDLRAERASKEIPYDAVSLLARAAVLGAAFDSLRHYEAAGPRGIASGIDEVSNAVGLNPDDTMQTKIGFFQTLVWHLLADDRMHEGQERRLTELREALGLQPADVEKETRAIREFQHLRGVRADSLPVTDATVPLKFQEICFESTIGKLLRNVARRRRAAPVWREAGDASVHVTSKRTLITTKKTIDIPRADLFELEVDYDRGILSMSTGEPKRYDLELPEPIFTAAIADISRKLRDKPAGLV